MVADPALIFSGLIDDTAITLGDTATVSLAVENRIIAWERPKVRRYTNEDQQQRFAGDKAFEFVNPTVEKELLWGTGSTAQVPRVQPAATVEPVPDTGARGGDGHGDGGGDTGTDSGGGGAGPGDTGSGGTV